MCLIVLPGCKPEIATKDIVCYKLVEYHIKYWKPCIYDGAEYSYPYNKILTAEYCINGEIRPIQHLEILHFVDSLYIIDEGFHADCTKTCRSMKLCIIPKGTEYCLGKENEIVAVNMIVFRTMLGYYWYRIKKLWREYIQTVK